MDFTEIDQKIKEAENAVREAQEAYDESCVRYNILRTQKKVMEINDKIQSGNEAYMDYRNKRYKVLRVDMPDHVSRDYTYKIKIIYDKNGNETVMERSSFDVRFPGENRFV